MDERPAKLVYIIGYGRSGSTLLAVVLGNHAEVESVGELWNFLRAGQRCACGSLGVDCDYWKRVRERWRERLGPESPETFARLDRRYRRWYARWALILSGRYRRAASVARYRFFLETLIASVRDVSGKAVVLDASKDPARALILHESGALDVLVIHLVRDVRAVAWSLQKSFRRGKTLSAASTALRWVATNVRAELAKRVIGLSLVVRYEALVNDPAATLEGIARFCDLDPAPLARKVAADEPLAVGHNIGGNRLRMRGEIRLRADREWEHEMAERDKRSAWRLSAWLMNRYGYRA